MFKKPDFVKARTAETDFLTFKAKTAFCGLQKASTKAPILYLFDLESHIQIETDTSSYAIWGVLGQLILDKPFSDNVTFENTGNFSKSEISL